MVWPLWGFGGSALSGVLGQSPGRRSRELCLPESETFCSYLPAILILGERQMHADTYAIITIKLAGNAVNQSVNVIKLIQSFRLISHLSSIPNTEEF